MNLINLIIPTLLVALGLSVLVRDLNLLPEPPPAIVGMDLGTTYSSVAYFKNGYGPIVIPDSYGRKVFPSIVSFLDNGTVLVGQEAKDMMEINPSNTIYDAKRFIGKQFEDININELNYYLFTVVNKSNQPQFLIHKQGREMIVSPKDISSLVLLKLKKNCRRLFRKTN